MNQSDSKYALEPSKFALSLIRLSNKEILRVVPPSGFESPKFGGMMQIYARATGLKLVFEIGIKPQAHLNFSSTKFDNKYSANSEITKNVWSYTKNGNLKKISLWYIN